VKSSKLAKSRWRRLTGMAGAPFLAPVGAGGEYSRR
jgi:hypothetical protein